MPITHIPAQNFKTTTWSGGTTTELFIYPATANYQQRDFDFRISTAKVEVQQSDFTSLPGYSRKLMVLDGTVVLSHENRHSKKLGKFEVDEFEGDWKTASAGKCTDFNLMTKAGITGSVSGETLKEGSVLNLEIGQQAKWYFLYLFSGSVEISFNGKTALVSKGGFVVFENPDNETLQITAKENSDLVFTEIYSKAL